MKLYSQDKKKLVNSVFNNVYHKYDVMNDLMSFGAHRIWKKNLISWMNPQHGNNLIDVASGTGDLAKLYSTKIDNNCKIMCVEPNKGMLSVGKKKLKNMNNIIWHQSPAEELPFKDNTFDFYTISFGIRNVTNINKSLQEAFRVLKTGGRFFCLEFSKVENEILYELYNQYSKIIPTIGKYFAGDEMAYNYLVDSIKSFYNQADLKDIIEKNSFKDVEFRNLSGGISAIHTGWKL